MAEELEKLRILLSAEEGSFSELHLLGRIFPIPIFPRFGPPALLESSDMIAAEKAVLLV